MIEDIIRDAEKRMTLSVESLRTELSRMRTGRANASLLDQINIDYYGTTQPLKQVANVAVEDARTLTITPWDKAMVPAVEKAILNSELGLNPVTAGAVVRVPMPPLTEERRKEIVKLVKQEAEGGRVAVRNIRRDANSSLKQLLKDKEISEDEEKRAEESIQKLTDKYVHQVDDVLAKKEKDLMEV